MKNKVGIYISNYGISNVDISTIKKVNPGIGGTQYEMFLFSLLLEKSNKYDIHTILDFPQKGFTFKNVHYLKSQCDIFELCHSLDLEILILRANCFLEKCECFGSIKIIYWVHNFIDYNAAKIISSLKNVKAVIFVSKQQYDFYRELDIIKKATYIYNTLFIPKNIISLPKKKFDVVFTGNLVYTTRFHVATSIWPWIVKKIPNARLHVIGSGLNGNRNLKLGRRGIAEETYEDLIFAPLEKNKVVDSVIFHGNLGCKKNKIISKCSLALAPNKDETFCISACEYILNGTPVVALKSGGLVDVVKNKQTGYLCKTPKSLAKTVVNILNGKNVLNINDSKIEYMRSNFGYKAFTNKWIQTIEMVLSNESFKKIAPSRPYDVSFKIIGIIFEKIRVLTHASDKLSRHYIRSKMK